MAGVQDRELAIAVSLAGGLGSLPCAMLNIDTARSELSAINLQTDKPVNVNFFCHTPPIPDAKRESDWRTILGQYYGEFGISTDDIPVGSARNPFSHEMVDVLEEYKPGIVSFHFGLPAGDLLERVKAMGTKIIASATTVSEAIWLESQGVDAIIAQGVEAGGHRGMFQSNDLTTQVGTFALLPQILQKVDLPVIAAGGIADSKGVTAALALGAIAVQIGTSYLLCNEATTSKVHRRALKSENIQHTAVTNVFSGRPARAIVNRLVREIGPISASAPEFPLAANAISRIRKQAEATGSGDFSPLWCGQNATGCKEISAGKLTKDLAANL